MNENPTISKRRKATIKQQAEDLWYFLQQDFVKDDIEKKFGSSKARQYTRLLLKDKEAVKNDEKAKKFIKLANELFEEYQEIEGNPGAELIVGKDALKPVGMIDLSPKKTEYVPRY